MAAGWASGEKGTASVERQAACLQPRRTAPSLAGSSTAARWASTSPYTWLGRAGSYSNSCAPKVKVFRSSGSYPSVAE